MSTKANPESTNQRLRGALSILFGAGVWGLFWIPLRYLANFGIEGMWAVAATLAVPLALALPFMFRRLIKRCDSSFVFLGICIGSSVVLYFGGVLFSDVVRVIFLFYMLPIWTTLLGRLFNKELISPRKLIAIIMALLGLYLLLGGANGIPLPSNIGDWFGLASGFLWASSLVFLRHNSTVDPILATAAPFVFGAPIAIVAAVLMMVFAPQLGSSLPVADELFPGLAFAGLFGLIVMAPSIYGQVWGARLIPSSSAALVTMIELITATVSAFILIGTSLDSMALIGGVIIAGAAVFDITAPTDADAATAATDT